MIQQPLLFELMGKSFLLCFQKRGSYVFVNTESVGSRRNHLNILVWRAVDHATVSQADAGPCMFN